MLIMEDDNEKSLLIDISIILQLLLKGKKLLYLK
jgi:hypothetical protein